MGPTGSGKSSILDALSYALYGKTSRVKKGQTRLISSRCDEANVRLVFAADDRKWQVSRTLKRKGSGLHVLEDLDSGDKIVGADAVENKIQEILGLDFEAFCSSVLLAQGQFARFLEATTTERTAILKGVFRLDQIDALRAAAKGRISDLRLQLAEIEGERNAFPQDPRAELREARGSEKEWRNRAKVLEKAIPQEKKLQEELDRATRRVAEVKEISVRALQVLKSIPGENEFAAIASEEGDVEKRFGEAQENAARAAAELAAAKAELESLEKRLGEQAALQDVLAQARRLEETAAQVLRLENQLGELTQDVAEREKELQSARAAEERAADALERAQSDLRELEQAHKAHALRADLAPGEPCPVCEQSVTTLPRTKPPAALRSASTALDEAKADHDAARLAREAAEKDLARAITLKDGRADELERERRRFVELDGEVAATVGKVSEPVTEIEERLAQIRAATQGVEDASARVELHRKELDDARAVRESFSARRRRLATVLIEIAGKLDVEPPEIDAPGDKLARHAQDVRAEVDKEIERARDALEGAVAAQDTARSGLDALHGSLDLEEAGTIVGALAEANTQAGVAAEQSHRLERVIERSQELDGLERTLATKLQIFDQLADDMRNERFINFLLEDRRLLLSEIGSERLREMTGRYRFDDKGNFKIVDELDADKMRDVDTLSGGETFLASLALALALAEAVARHGGRMQCFFIDEGFGSLDPESLDLALDGIEKIAGRDRLIGLVSHVAELGRRIEDKIVLDKAPDATTVVVSGG